MTSRIIPVEPFDLVVFGGTGDLTYRKLLPALYHRFRDGQMPPEARIFAVSRRAMDDDTYRGEARAALERYVRAADRDEAMVQAFLDRVAYVPVDVSEVRQWAPLKTRVSDRANRVRVFYLATSPELFQPICETIVKVGLSNPSTRVVLEKPIGTDLESARAINDAVGAVFTEGQVYRIDHYLGKETVQNLMALRFANALFEPIWNAGHIDHVQITVAETVGVEQRGAYYDHAGALRDMLQNHIMQLLCLVAMEPPASMSPDTVRDEKLKVLRALKPIGAVDAVHATVRGQYRSGAIGGEGVPAYLDEPGVTQDSRTETFVALKGEVDNWRWAGVPFYLRTGKRMATRVSEIVVTFRAIPHSIFDQTAGQVVPNRLVIRLQPDEGVKMLLMIKDPGPGGMRLREVPLNLSFAEAFGIRAPDAYERLLMDVVRGNQTLFMRRDEVEAAWTWTDPILEAWSRSAERPRPYTAGTWGPSAAVALIERDGRTWYEDLI